MLLEIAKFLDLADTLDPPIPGRTAPDLTLQDDLFVDRVTSEDDKAIDNLTLIVVASGRAPFASSDRRETLFDFFVRNTEPLTAKSTAEVIFSFLHGLSGVTLPVIDGEPHAWIADTFEGQDIVRPLGADDRGRFTYTFSIVVRGHAI